MSSSSDIIHDNNTSKETKLIKLSTNMGDITLELFQDKAPETVANFLKYINDGKLNGTIFHRVIPNFMIQGGGHLPYMSQIDTYDPVINESNNNISNKKGTIAMARTSSPNSATSQFFINLVNNERLDFQNSSHLKKFHNNALLTIFQFYDYTKLHPAHLLSRSQHRL